MRAAAAPVGSPWMWTLAFGHHQDRTPTNGYEATREQAMGGIRKELAEGVESNDRTSGGECVIVVTVAHIVRRDRSLHLDTFDRIRVTKKGVQDSR